MPPSLRKMSYDRPEPNELAVTRASLAAALIASDLMPRYSEYAHKANPETMEAMPLEDLAAHWSDALFLALRILRLGAPDAT